MVLTGGSSGIGQATARVLASRAGRLIVHGLEGEQVRGDFRRLAEVAAVARQIGELTERVDVLINNAGMPGPPRRTMTADGHEVTLQVNVLAGALLTDLPLSLIPDHGRVVNVASATHCSASLELDDLELERGSYSPVRAYAHSTLALVTYSVWLSGLHSMFGAGGAPVDRAASVLADLAERPLERGAYYDEHDVATPNPEALDRGNQERLARYVGAAIRRR